MGLRMTLGAMTRTGVVRARPFEVACWLKGTRPGSSVSEPVSGGGVEVVVVVLVEEEACW